MNFRTTILLLVLLAAVGGYLLYTGFNDTPDAKKTETSDEQKLVDIAPADVTRVVIRPKDGPATLLEKSGTEWRLVEPTAGVADAAEVDALVRELTDLRSRSRIDADRDKGATGLDQPAFHVELTAADGKTAKLSVGSKSAIGDNLYVQVDGRDQADVVSAAVYERLEKPASGYRQTKLFTATNDQIRRLEITPAGANAPAVRLERGGDSWHMVTS